MTDKRLLCVASMVRAGASLADVGTDHAYLPVYLIQQGHITAAVAADIGEGPAASARTHVAQAGLCEAIDVRVGDGLSVVSPEEVSDIVIAGMGGETIIHILSQASWVCDARYRLVLQPMTKTVELRRWLYQNGFTIDEEHVVPDGRHLYSVMAAHHTDAVPPEDPLLPYVGALAADKEARPYFEQQCCYLRQKIDGSVRAGKSEEAAALTPILEQLSSYIKKG